MIYSSIVLPPALCFLLRHPFRFQVSLQTRHLFGLLQEGKMILPTANDARSVH